MLTPYGVGVLMFVYGYLVVPSWQVGNIHVSSFYVKRLPFIGNELMFNLKITIMKKLFLLLAAICVASSAFAQTPIKYQGEVDLGYSLGVGEFATGRVNIHTIHGAKNNLNLPHPDT